MAHYIYVFVPPWHITYICLFHDGTLHSNEEMGVGVGELL